MIDALYELFYYNGSVIFGNIVAFILLLFFVRWSKKYNKKHGHDPVFLQILTLILASAIIAVTFIDGSVNKDFNSSEQAVFYAAIYFVIVLFWMHMLAHKGGGALTRLLGTRNWVKAIDYVYLLLCLLGLQKVTTHVWNNTPTMTGIDGWLPVALATAVAIRMTKTSIEIFGWDHESRSP